MGGPHAHHALLTPTDDACAVRGPTDGSHCPLVGVMNGVQQLAALRPKSSDLTITPPTDDALPILHHHAMKVALEECFSRLRSVQACSNHVHLEGLV